MADETPKPPWKTVLNESGGPPPGYAWSVLIFDRAYREARALLTDEQYDFIADEIRELARDDEPSRSDVLDVRSIEDYYELRCKGGVLKKINLRVFYWPDHDARSLVILGAINKKYDGATATETKALLRSRLRAYAGES